MFKKKITLIRKYFHFIHAEKTQVANLSFSDSLSGS